MGFWRTIYYYLDWEYIGKKEQEDVERQKHLKYMTCEQIKKGGVKLKRKELLFERVLKRHKKRKK
jgi:hypothetical protein